MAWYEIVKDQLGEIRAALELLQETSPGDGTSPGNYDHLRVEDLNDKLTAVTRNGHELWALRLYSYGVQGDEAPLVSAFFFLRRRKKVGTPSDPNDPDNPDNPNGPEPFGQWAYCLTVGAKDSGEGGLSKDALRDELKDRCIHVKNEYHRPRELMHLLEGPSVIPVNLMQVYTELKTNSTPPKLMDKGTIVLGPPWVRSGTETYRWFVINEGG